jgi:beta-glucosidase
VALQPGETQSVAIKLDFRAFAYYHPKYKQWITEDGDFDILIGASSADIRGTLTVSLQSTLELPCILNRESTLRAWMEDPRGKRAFEPLFKQVIAPMQATFGGGQGEGGLDMDPSGFLTDMALRDILEFVSNALPKSPDELVDEMLKQAYSPDK